MTSPSLKQKGLFDSPTGATAKPVPMLTLEIPGRLPSWNDLLGMEQWARYKFKQDLADDFLSVLRASADDYSTSTISQRNIMSIYADTLELYLRTRQEERKLKLAKKRLEARNKNLFESKFSESKVPF